MAVSVLGLSCTVYEICYSVDENLKDVLCTLERFCACVRTPWRGNSLDARKGFCMAIFIQRTRLS